MGICTVLGYSHIVVGGCTVLGYSHVVCFSRFSMSSGYLYCIRVLTHGMFKQVFYEQRVFVLY